MCVSGLFYKLFNISLLGICGLAYPNVSKQNNEFDFLFGNARRMA
jgi:hypothetical protein